MRASFAANPTRQSEIVPKIDSQCSLVPHGNYLFLAGDSLQPTEYNMLTDVWPPMVEPKALFFGYSLPQKGLSDLVEAFAEVVRQLPEARLS